MERILRLALAAPGRRLPHRGQTPMPRNDVAVSDEADGPERIDARSRRAHAHPKVSICPQGGQTPVSKKD